MIKEASKILQLIIEFCRDNLDILMIGGVAAIALILLVSGIKYFKDEDDDDEDIEIDELELLEIVEQVKQMQEEKEEKVEDEEAEEDEVEVVLPPLTARIMAEDESADEPAANELVEDEQADEEPLEFANEKQAAEKSLELPQEEPSKNTSTIENLVEEIANLSGTGVKEVEIKVPGAKVKITYSRGDDNAKNGETQDASEGRNLDANTDDEPSVHSESGVTKAPNSADILGGNGNLNGNLNGITADGTGGASSVIKFGPDNINMSRSGRIYSEEELQQQIRD